MREPAQVVREELRAERDIRREIAATVAAHQIGPLKPGIELFGITKGNFSKVDIIRHLVSEAGPCDAVISTWTAGAYDAAHLLKFCQEGNLRSARFILDESFQARQPQYLAAVRRYFGEESIRITRTHAKFAVLTNERWNLVLRTSMNLNENRRIETFEISDDERLAAFLLEYTDEMFGTHPVGEPNRGAARLEFDRFGEEMSHREAEDRLRAGEPRKDFFGEGIASIDVRRIGWSTGRGKVLK